MASQLPLVNTLAIVSKACRIAGRDPGASPDKYTAVGCSVKGGGALSAKGFLSALVVVGESLIYLSETTFRAGKVS
jgi:hypothetical protein